MPKITKRLVDSLESDTARDLFVWDSELKGFGLRIKPSGARQYLVQYRNASGASKRLGLGKHGVLTPEQARDMARERLAAVAMGNDPAAEREATRTALTVAELCALYLEQAKSGQTLGRRGRKIKASTLAMDKSRIDRHVVPLLGKISLRSLTSDDIARMQASIAAGKTAPRKPVAQRGGVTSGGTGVAARTTGMLRTILEFALRQKLIDSNPAAGVKKMADGKADRFLHLDEIKALGRAMREAEAEGENATGLAAIRFLLLTGLRRMEALALPWDWVDARARCLRLADSKSGAQMRPIGAAALSFLKTWPRAANARWVFPGGSGDGHFIGLPRVLARVSARAKLEGVTIHCLRHSFASAAAELGFSELTIAGLLGHSVPGVTARYAHVPDSALLAAADRVSACVEAALDGKRPADVMDLKALKSKAQG